MGSGSVSLPSRGSFHLSLTVLVRYRSVASIQPWRVGPPDSGGVSRVPPYLGCRWVSQGFAQGAVTRCGAPFQALALAVLRPCPGPATPGDGSPGLGYLRNRVFLLLLRLLRCFTSPGLARSALFGSCTRGILWDAGFPHSETSGSKTACVSPELIAAYRVLRRLPPPRHPPCARTVWTPKTCAQAALASRPHGITRNGGLSLDRARGNHGPASVVFGLWKKIHRRRLVDMRRPRPVAKEVCRIRDPT